jgi:spore germination protein (amino acid permease)
MIPLIKNEHEKLSPFHIFILVYMSQAGIVLFTLPRELADHFGTNGWLFLFICFAISTFNIYLVSVIYRLGKGRSIFEILEQSISKSVLYPAYIGIAAVWIMFGCIIGKKYVLLFQLMAFPSVNPMIIKLAVDVLAFLLLIKGIYNISKASTLFFWMTIWLVLLLIAFIPEFSWVRLTPFVFRESHNVLKGGIDIYAAFLGYELCMLFLPYMEKKKSILAMYLGNAFLTMIYMSLSLICFGFFSFGQLKKLLFPVLDMLAYIRFPFVERIENLFYGVFLYLILITLLMYLWAGQEAIFRITRKARSPRYTFVVIAITYCISFIPKTLDQVNVWITYLGYMVTAIGFMLPMVVIVVLLIQRRARETHG